jgi:hypothetical protein
MKLGDKCNIVSLFLFACSDNMALTHVNNLCIHKFGVGGDCVIPRYKGGS